MPQQEPDHDHRDSAEQYFCTGPRRPRQPVTEVFFGLVQSAIGRLAAAIPFFLQPRTKDLDGGRAALFLRCLRGISHARLGATRRAVDQVAALR
jgi:hypothetical protein